MYIFTGMFILALFALIAVFTLNRRESLVWLFISVACGSLALFLRYRFPPSGTVLDGAMLVQIDLFMIVMSAVLLLFGYRVEGMVEKFIGQNHRKSHLVAEHKEKLEELFAREKTIRVKYESLFSLIPDLLYVTDLSGNLLDVNQALLDFVGVSRENILGESVFGFFAGSRNDVLEETAAKLRKGITVNGIEVEAKGREGTVRCFDIKSRPIFEEGRVVRVLNLARDVTERKAMESLINERSEELYRLSITDSLTGLNNRMKVDESLSGEVKTSTRYGTEFSVILTDIDHFKGVNDRFGHATGDEVLKNVSRVLKENIRQTDLVGRWGGEEFLIVCPRTNSDDAFTLADKLRTLIRNITFRDDLSITASFGVTEYGAGDDLISIMARVDKALYQAKESGRDRTVAL